MLVSEEDWNAMAETLHLLSVPEIRESIKEGIETLIEECSNELDLLNWPLIYKKQAQKGANTNEIEHENVDNRW